MKGKAFKDRAKIYVSSGRGGNGAATFRREKFIPYGGPNGGDGGRGGHVFILADENLDSLLHLVYVPHQRARNGEAGMNRECHGKNADDLYVKVPPGTMVYDDEGGFVGEVLHSGDQFMLAKGGRGGLGNCHFKTSTHQAPRECTPGEEGEQKTLQLELKLVADVGLVGYPNAGKSTLISKLSNAHPKIAPYPFTTLNPIIGTVMYDDFTSLRIADIPGLIDGANEGIGLGHAFLRHIERTRFLLFILDMAGVDGRDPAEDYINLRKELRLYRHELDARPYLLVANKMDLPEAWDNYKAFIEATGETPVSISAEAGEGVDLLKQQLKLLVPPSESLHESEPEPEPW
ncbi:MAG: GTPase ObgE [Kiritimatiellae bacterium]|nr:GTPase ObgE [Kiritimatiellia bacterium]